MRRVVSLWFPTWPTDRLRRQPDAPPPDKPLITATREGSRRLVGAADRQARAAGVQPGMTVAHAQAVASGLTVLEADPEGDLAALEKLAVWCVRHSPIVATDPPDGIVIDITGCAHLFGGEAALLSDIRRRIRQAGVSVRLAVTDTWAASRGFARFHPSPAIVPAGKTAQAITALPVAGLRLDAETVATLKRLGLETVGMLAAAPRASLTLRFGPGLVRRIDQAFGRAPEPIDPIVPPKVPCARLAFAEPIGDARSVSIAVSRLTEQLCADLESRGIGARRLDLLLTRVDGQIEALRVGASQATRDPRHLVRLFDEKLDKVNPGYGIESARLIAPLVEPLHARQLAVEQAGRRGPDLPALIDRIANRIGESHLYRLAPVESDIPERALKRLPALSPPTRADWPGDLRPARLIMPPEPVQVTALLPDHPPALFVWRGDARRVRSADGPERIYGEWWRGDGEVDLIRDYFRVETEAGERFWLFRAMEQDGARWFVQGVFA